MHTIKPVHSVLEGKQAPHQCTSQQVVVHSDPLPYLEDPSIALANAKRKVGNTKMKFQILFICVGKGKVVPSYFMIANKFSLQ